MKLKTRWKIPLMGFGHLDIPPNPSYEQLFAAASELEEKANDGTAIHEYFNDVERFAEGVFRDQRIDLNTNRRSRCDQIVQEYETPTLDQFEKQISQMREQFLNDPASIGPRWRDFFIEPANVVTTSVRLHNHLGYKPLRRDQIDARLYCAAKVLVCVEGAAVASGADCQASTDRCSARVGVPAGREMATAFSVHDGLHPQA